jgi:hypothetical protein
MPEIRFAAPLPPDVPAPPAGLGGWVRWPDGVYRPPGERPDGGVGYETGHSGRKRNEPHPLTQPHRARVALPASLALGAATLAAWAFRRRRRQ